jgi:hypothetical protein
MKKKILNEYDETKKLLNILRNLSKNTKPSYSLNEQEQPQDTELPSQKATENLKNDILNINNCDVKINYSDDADKTLNEDQKKAISDMLDSFKQQVSEMVEFDPGMTINPDQIRLDGYFIDKDLSFVLIAGKEYGAYLNCDMVKIEQDIVDIISKLQKFVDSYLDSMGEIITFRKNN